MITQEDLDWWLGLAPTLEWQFATTYAETAPHSYVVHGRTGGMALDDYIRAARVIHTFGRPQKFYGMTNIYLTSPDGRLKWWTMDTDVRETNLVNQATTDRLYGVQNAPVTESGISTPYDPIASEYDEMHPTSHVLNEALAGAVEKLRGRYPPSVLDVGCGTGRMLDLALTTPDRYAGVDPSTPMLNQLVRKHPTVAALYPMRIERARTDAIFTDRQFEIVTAVIDPADELVSDTVDALRRIASRGLVVGRGDDVKVLP